MSYVPNHAMKHAHADPATPAEEPSTARRALVTIEHAHPPMWTMVAAGVAGAVATALFLTLRSSSRPARPAPRRKAPARRKKSD